MSSSPKSVCEHPVFSRQEGWGQSSCDKLNKIEQVDLLSTLQDGRLTSSKVHVATRGLHAQIRQKDAYFLVPLHRNCRNKVRFQWSGKLYEFLYRSFSLGPAPRIFTKILKVAISLIRRLNIKIVIYLDDMLLLGRSF